MIETGWLGAVTTNLGSGMELQVIAAAVIGGANLAGGIAAGQNIRLSPYILGPMEKNAE